MTGSGEEKGTGRRGKRKLEGRNLLRNQRYLRRCEIQRQHQQPELRSFLLYFKEYFQKTNLNISKLFKELNGAYVYNLLKLKLIKI